MKAVLQAEESFFSGKDGFRRWIDGRYIEPDEAPSYEAFVKRSFVRNEVSTVTVADAFQHYYEFCKANKWQPLRRHEFKQLVAEVVRQEFRLGLRHDILNEEGKQQHGWRGIQCIPASMN